MDYKKVLLLHFTQGLSGRSIAEVTGVSKSTINEFLKRFRESKELYYPLPEDVTNEAIAALLYKKAGNPSTDLYRDFNIEDVHRALPPREKCNSVVFQRLLLRRRNGNLRYKQLDPCQQQCHFLLWRNHTVSRKQKRVMRPGTTLSANHHASAQVAPQLCPVL